MTKPKSQRLEIVRKLASQKEQQAAQQLLLQRQQLEQEQQQLHQLQLYYSDYLERIEKQKQIGIAEMLTYREFSGRLADAVRQQSQKIQVFQNNVDKANQKWNTLRRRRIAIEDVIAQSLLEEEGHRVRVEQKLLDEVANNQAVLKSLSHTSSFS